MKKLHVSKKSEEENEMKRLLLLFTVLSLPAFVPPPKPSKDKKLPTFEQMIKEGEERRQKMPQLLEKLPAELRREILRIMSQSEVLNIPALAQGITTLAATNKALHEAINNPQNMLIILKSLPKAGAKLLASGLRNMPGIKSKEVQDWLEGIKLEHGAWLYNSLVRGRLGIVAEILENPNLNVNWKDEQSGLTILMQTVLHRYELMIQHLLAAGANVNAKDKEGWTPLMFAANKGYPEIAKILITAGADVNAKDKDGNTALMRASSSGSTETVRLLLAAGADVNEKNDAGVTALMRARAEARDYTQRANKYNAVIKLLEEAEKAQKEKAARK